MYVCTQKPPLLHTIPCPTSPPLNIPLNTKSSTMNSPQKDRFKAEAFLVSAQAQAQAQEAKEDQDKKKLGEESRRSLLSPRIFRTTGGPRLRLGFRAASNGRWCA